MSVNIGDLVYSINDPRLAKVEKIERGLIREGKFGSKIQNGVKRYTARYPDGSELTFFNGAINKSIFKEENNNE